MSFGQSKSYLIILWDWRSSIVCLLRLFDSDTTSVYYEVKLLLVTICKSYILILSRIWKCKICHIWNISKNVKLFCCWYFAFTFNRYLSCTPRELCLFRSEIVNIFEYHMTESRIKRRNLLPWYQNLHVFFLRMAVHHANKCTYTSRR